MTPSPEDFLKYLSSTERIIGLDMLPQILGEHIIKELYRIEIRYEYFEDDEANQVRAFSDLLMKGDIPFYVAKTNIERLIKKAFERGNGCGELSAIYFTLSSINLTEDRKGVKLLLYHTPSPYLPYQEV